MRLRLVRASGWPRIGWGPTFWGALWVLALLVGIAWGLARTGGPTLCHFKRVTGIPCPTCGGTRAAGHLLAGDVLLAFQTNPLLFLVGMALVAILAFRLVGRRRLEVETSPGVRRRAWWIFALLVLVNWAYLVVFVG